MSAKCRKHHEMYTDAVCAQTLTLENTFNELQCETPTDMKRSEMLFNSLIKVNDIMAKFYQEIVSCEICKKKHTKDKVIH